MGQIDRDQDYLLVQKCLEGSEAAWQAFYSKYVGLMRNVVRKYGILSNEDVQDIVQTSFLTLTSALRSFDPQNSLAHFVCMITERALIDDIRKSKAAKRSGETQSIDTHDGADENAVSIKSEARGQDVSLEQAQLAVKLRACLEEMDARCRELIRLRYYQELSFTEIAQLLKVNENTLNVQTRRCLGKLKEKYALSEKGTGS